MPTENMPSRIPAHTLQNVAKYVPTGNCAATYPKHTQYKPVNTGEGFICTAMYCHCSHAQHEHHQLLTPVHFNAIPDAHGVKEYAHVLSIHSMWKKETDLQGHRQLLCFLQSCPRQCLLLSLPPCASLHCQAWHAVPSPHMKGAP